MYICVMCVVCVCAHYRVHCVCISLYVVCGVCVCVASSFNVHLCYVCIVCKVLYWYARSCSVIHFFLSLCAYTSTVLDIKRVENPFFHSMYIFSVILHAIDKQDIST